MLQISELVDDVDLVDGAKFCRLPRMRLGYVGGIYRFCPRRRWVFLVVNDEEILCQLKARDIDRPATVSYVPRFLIFKDCYSLKELACMENMAQPTKRDIA